MFILHRTHEMWPDFGKSTTFSRFTPTILKFKQTLYNTNQYFSEHSINLYDKFFEISNTSMHAATAVG